MKENKLVLFTSEFPCGSGEPFLINEFYILSKKFDKVIIFPRLYSSEIKYTLPENTVVENIWSYPRKSNKQVLIQNIALVFKVLMKELISSLNPSVFIKHIREFNSYLLNAVSVCEPLEKYIEENKLQSAVFYSFWMNEWSLSLANLKEKNVIKHFCFRTNGFDLYENQTRWNYIPFKPFIFSKASRMFAVSKKGAEHMRKTKVNADRITHSYFGTQNLGPSVFDPGAMFTIFTCSDLRGLKRVDRMVDILKHIPFSVKWVHHGHKGDAQEIFYKKIKDLPAHITFELHERKEKYADVLTFFKENHFNLFALLSRTEGIPVSLIEAISFGIPILGTDVGGVSEVITAENGILIEKDFNDKQVAEKISVFKNSSLNSEEGRKKIREDWNRRFNMEINYESFYNQLINS